MATDDKLIHYINEQLKNLFMGVDVITDPYQKTMAKARLLEILIETEKLKNNDVKNFTPSKGVTAKTQVKDLNPSAPLADKISSKIEEIQNATTVESIAPKADPTPQKLPEDWQTRELKMEEYDATWTDKMLANDRMMYLYKSLVGFFITGLAKNMYTQDWLDAALAKYTQSKITHFNQPTERTEEAVRTAINQIPPASAEFILNAMKQAYEQYRTHKAA